MRFNRCDRTQKSACSTFLKESIEILLKKHNHNNVDLHLDFPANCIKESEYFAKIYSGLMMIKDLSVEVDYDYACRYYETAFDPDEICTNRDKQLYDQMSNYQKTLCGKRTMRVVHRRTIKASQYFLLYAYL